MDILKSSWLWKQYQAQRGYTVTEDGTISMYREQLDEILKAETQVDIDITNANNSLVSLKKKQQYLEHHCTICKNSLQMLVKDNVSLTEEQQQTRTKILRTIDEDLKPVMKQVNTSITNLERMMAILEQKKADIAIKRKVAEDNLSTQDHQFPLHDIHMIEEGKLNDSSESITNNTISDNIINNNNISNYYNNSSTSNNTNINNSNYNNTDSINNASNNIINNNNNNMFKPSEEAVIPIDTPVIQMMDASLLFDGESTHSNNINSNNDSIIISNSIDHSTTPHQDLIDAQL